MFVSKKGDVMECSIWSGPQKGVRIGEVNRRLHFSRTHERILIEIEGEECTVNFSEFQRFWTTCPEIRVAKNDAGKNKLKEFIENNNLLPPKESSEKKGRADKIYLEVVVPYQRFRIRV